MINRLSLTGGKILNNNRDYDSYNTNENTSSGTKGRPPKKKFKFHPNKDGIMALLVLFLVVVLIITIIVCCAKAISDAVNKNKESGGTTTPSAQITVPPSGTSENTTSTSDTATTGFITTAPPAGAWNANYVIKNLSSDMIHEGNLILVNGSNEYTFPKNMERAIVDLYGNNGYGSVYVIRDTSVKLNTNIVSPLVSMLSALKAANSETLSEDKLLISSGYRDFEYQQSLYDKAVARGEEGYSQRAGYSEHHTGLAFDLKIYTAAKTTVDLRYAEQNWILDNCAEYGFILRYDDSKKDITKILGESWHFRYVGVCHAKYMTDNDICLEEYIDLLRTSHTYGKSDPLTYSYGGKNYTIYFVPADKDGGMTSVPVPSDASTYEVSGNNVDGFIVTVTK